MDYPSSHLIPTTLVCTRKLSQKLPETVSKGLISPTTKYLAFVSPGSFGFFDLESETPVDFNQKKNDSESFHGWISYNDVENQKCYHDVFYCIDSGRVHLFYFDHEEQFSPTCVYFPGGKPFPNNAKHRKNEDVRLSHSFILNLGLSSSETVLSVVSSDNNLAVATNSQKVYVLTIEKETQKIKKMESIRKKIFDFSLYKNQLFGLWHNRSRIHVWNIDSDKLVGTIDVMVDNVKSIFVTSENNLILRDTSDRFNLLSINEVLKLPKNFVDETEEENVEEENDILSHFVSPNIPKLVNHSFKLEDSMHDDVIDSLIFEEDNKKKEQSQQETYIGVCVRDFENFHVYSSGIIFITKSQSIHLFDFKSGESSFTSNLSDTKLLLCTQFDLSSVRLIDKSLSVYIPVFAQTKKRVLKNALLYGGREFAERMCLRNDWPVSNVSLIELDLSLINRNIETIENSLSQLTPSQQVLGACVLSKHAHTKLFDAGYACKFLKMSRKVLTKFLEKRLNELLQKGEKGEKLKVSGVYKKGELGFFQDKIQQPSSDLRLRIGVYHSLIKQHWSTSGGIKPFGEVEEILMLSDLLCHFPPTIEKEKQKKITIKEQFESIRELYNERSMEYISEQGTKKGRVSESLAYLKLWGERKIGSNENTKVEDLSFKKFTKNVFLHSVYKKFREKNFTEGVVLLQNLGENVIAHMKVISFSTMSSSLRKPLITELNRTKQLKGNDEKIVEYLEMLEVRFFEKNKIVIDDFGKIRRTNGSEETNKLNIPLNWIREWDDVTKKRLMIEFAFFSSSEWEREDDRGEDFGKVPLLLHSLDKFDVGMALELLRNGPNLSDLVKNHIMHRTSTSYLKEKCLNTLARSGVFIEKGEYLFNRLIEINKLLTFKFTDDFDKRIEIAKFLIENNRKLEFCMFFQSNRDFFLKNVFTPDSNFMKEIPIWVEIILKSGGEEIDLVVLSLLNHALLQKLEGKEREKINIGELVNSQTPLVALSSLIYFISNEKEKGVEKVEMKDIVSITKLSQILSPYETLHNFLLSPESKEEGQKEKRIGVSYLLPTWVQKHLSTNLLASEIGVKYEKLLPPAKGMEEHLDMLYFLRRGRCLHSYLTISRSGNTLVNLLGSLELDHRVKVGIEKKCVEIALEKIFSDEISQDKEEIWRQINSLRYFLKLCKISSYRLYIISKSALLILKESEGLKISKVQSTFENLKNSIFFIDSVGMKQLDVTKTGKIILKWIETSIFKSLKRNDTVIHSSTITGRVSQVLQQNVDIVQRNDKLDHRSFFVSPFYIAKQFCKLFLPQINFKKHLKYYSQHDQWLSLLIEAERGSLDAKMIRKYVSNNTLKEHLLVICDRDTQESDSSESEFDNELLLPIEKLFLFVENISVDKTVNYEWCLRNSEKHGLPILTILGTTLLKPEETVPIMEKSLSGWIRSHKLDIKLPENVNEKEADYLTLIEALCKASEFPIAISGLKIFLKNSILLPFVNFYSQFKQKRFEEAEGYLKRGVSVFESGKKEIQEFVKKLIFKNMRRDISLLYERNQFFKVLKSTKFMEYSEELKRLERVHDLLTNNSSIASFEVNVLNDSPLMMIDKLNKLYLFNLGYRVCAHLGVKLNDHVTKEQATYFISKMRSSRLWKYSVERRQVFKRCHDLFIRHGFKESQAGVFFIAQIRDWNKTLNNEDISCLLGLAKKWLHSHPEAALLETTRESLNDYKLPEGYRTYLLKKVFNTFINFSQMKRKDEKIIPAFSVGNNEDLENIKKTIDALLATDRLDEAIQVDKENFQKISMPVLVAKTASDLATGHLEPSEVDARIIKYLRGYHNSSMSQTTQALLSRLPLILYGADNLGARNFCRIVALDYELAIILSRTYEEIKKKNKFFLLRLVLRSGPKRYVHAGKFVRLHNLSVKKVANVVAEVIFKEFRVGGDTSLVVQANEENLVRLWQICQDAKVGRSLLKYFKIESQKSKEKRELTVRRRVNLALVIFSSCRHSTDLEGQEMLLDTLKETLIKELLLSEDYKLLIQLMTGFNDLSQLQNLFDTMFNKNQLEVLLSKGVLDSHKKNSFVRAALVQYVSNRLKGDEKEQNSKMKMVFNNFGRFREVGKMHFDAALEKLKEITERKFGTLRVAHLKNVFNLLEIAEASFKMDKCLGHLVECVKLKKKVERQIEVLDRSPKKKTQGSKLKEIFQAFF